MMTNCIYNVLGIGNAIVDIIADVNNEFLLAEGLEKGSMSLVDEFASKNIYNKIISNIRCSGGSAANTISGFSMLGNKSGYVGKVKDDELGQLFVQDITSLGVNFSTSFSNEGPSTANCLVLVTSDAQRTMVTYLGASVGLTSDDINELDIVNSEIIYLEGYLWDPPRAKKAFLKAAKLANEAERRVALSLSDSFCVDRHRSEFRSLIKNHIDIVFANEEEIISLYNSKNLEDAIVAIRTSCDLAVITRGARGSIVVRTSEIIHINAEPVQSVIDTTGAGDAYAAGFLHGLVNHFDFQKSARIGSICASEVITHYGARPETPLLKLIASC